MPFPPYRRVIYKRNPLREVICQLRFPKILLIDAETPAHFQERIRQVFPLYKQRLNLPLPEEILRNLPQDLLGVSQQKIHDFASKDEVWTVSLSSEFLAFTTRSYTTWEEFHDKLQNPLSALKEIYQPPYFDRVGLRYINLIDKEKLGLGQEKWGSLLQKHISAELSDESIGDNVRESSKTIVIRLVGVEGNVTVRHGLSIEADKPFYFIDNDFFVEAETDINRVDDILREFNIRSGRLFRWCITEKLHSAMEPSDIS